MRNKWILILCALVSIECTHPYEEGMLGSFPYFDLPKEDVVHFDYEANASDPLRAEINFTSNIPLRTEIVYMRDEASGNMDAEAWIQNVAITTTGAEQEKRLTFVVQSNNNRFPRIADIIISPEQNYGSTSLRSTLHVTQDAFDIKASGKVHEGDLILRNQKEIDNCVYVEVRGNLLLGDENAPGAHESLTCPGKKLGGGDIHNLDGLEMLDKIHGGIVLACGNNTIKTSALADLPVEFIEVIGGNPGTCSDLSVRTPKYVLNYTNGDNLSQFLGPINGLRELQMDHCRFSDYQSLANKQELKRVTISNNESGSLDPTVLFTSMPNLTHIVLKNDNIRMLPSSSYNCPNLTELDLADNQLRNITLAKENVPALRKLNLENNPIDRLHVNYLRTILPDVQISSYGIASSNKKLRIVQTEGGSTTVSFDLYTDNIQAQTAYAIIKVATGEEYKFELQDQPAPGKYVLGLMNMHPDTEHTIWLLVSEDLGTGPTWMLSEAYTWKTRPISIIDYNVTPQYPTLNNSSQPHNFQFMQGIRYNDNSEQKVVELQFIRNGETFTAKTEDGPFTRLLYATENDNPHVYIQACYEDEASKRLAYWSIAQNGNEGLNGDLAVLSASSTVSTDPYDETLPFIRPVVLLDFNLEVPAPAIRAEIDRIECKIDNCYDTFYLINDQVGYQGNCWNSFTAGFDPNQAVQTIQKNFSVFPTVKGTLHNVTLTIHFKTLPSTTLDLQIRQELVANNRYNLSTKLEKDQYNGSFTVEDIVIVQDEIEF